MLVLDRSQSHLPSLSTSSSAPRPSHTQQRPSMTKSESFDVPSRARSTPPVLGPANQNQPQQLHHPHQQPAQQHHNHHNHQNHQNQPPQQQQHQYSPSAGLSFQQPGMSPQQLQWMHHHQQQTGWNPAAGFYGAPFGPQQQHQMYQQQQQNLQAWAAAYQQTMMTSGAGGSPLAPFPGQFGGGSQLQRPPPHIDSHRRRTSSGPTPQQTTHEVSYFPSSSSSAHLHHRPSPSFTHHHSFSGQQPAHATAPWPSTPTNQSTPVSSAPSSETASTAPAAGGFHPYRRPDRRVTSGSSSSLRDAQPASSVPADIVPPTRPYARHEAQRSDTSVASVSSSSGAKRRDQQHGRSDSLAPPQHGRSAAAGTGTSPTRAASTDHARAASLSSSAGNSSGGGSISSLGAVVGNTTKPSPAPAPAAPPGAASSPSHSASSSTSTPAGASATTSAAGPSPLSQRQPVASEPAALSPSPVPAAAAQAPTPTMVKSGGLMGRLKGKLGNSTDDSSSSKKKAATASASGPSHPSSSSRSSTPTPRAISSPTPSPSTTSSRPQTPTFTSTPVANSDDASTRTTSGAPKRSRSLFNMKNASTDNISIASAASSASMMIRKIGSFGKLAKRNSLAGISNIFKDKDRKGESQDDGVLGSDSTKKKSGKLSGFRSRKAEIASPSITHFAAEQDRNQYDENRPVTGLSPAAKLARQHTLRAKAEEKEAAQRQSMVVEEDAAAAARSERRPSIEVPDTWARSTVNSRAGIHGGAAGATAGGRISEDSLLESEDDGEIGYAGKYHHQGGETLDDDDDDEELAHRIAHIGFGAGQEEEYERWGDVAPPPAPVTPVRGILKQTSSYGPPTLPPSLLDCDGAEEDPLVGPEPVWNRMRSNSTDQHGNTGNGGYLASPGGLTRIPSPDPDHIDGLHHNHPQRTAPHSPPIDAAVGDAYDPFSPNFSPFDQSANTNFNAEKRLSFPYSNPAANASAPSLSQRPTAGRSTNRNVTGSFAPRKTLVWAPNCAVYHTFHGSEYDRRSEPATCNRLTPQLASEIKAFLNQYKLEEMEVHPASHAYTQFFT